MLYKHSLSLSTSGLANFQSSLSLFIDETSKSDVIQGSRLIYFLFILVIFTGRDISNNDLYISKFS